MGNHLLHTGQHFVVADVGPILIWSIKVCSSFSQESITSDVRSVWLWVWATMSHNVHTKGIKSDFVTKGHHHRCAGQRRFIDD
jgi:hypothetical protein